MLSIQKIANYRIKSLLGRGGMGDVYHALQLPLEREVALKVLLSSTGNDQEAVQRFEMEARAIARLDHNNIVSLYDYGEENGRHYFAMQYIAGTDLNSFIQKKKVLPISMAIDFSRQIARGLLYAHSKGITHRDIKPHNILIDRAGTCLISDFGIAQMCRGNRVTMAGMVVGTPEYMSPEQAEGKPVDFQTDIYSMGILMYEMVTGKLPFTGDSPVAIAYRQVHDLPESPAKIRKDLPQRLELIILKALKKDKADRYRSLEGMLRDLDTIDTSKITSSVFAQESPSPVSRKKTSETQSESNRRITDRRNTQARPSAPVFNLFSLSFWSWAVRHQWLSLLLIAVLFLLYLVK